MGIYFLGVEMALDMIVSEERLETRTIGNSSLLVWYLCVYWLSNNKNLFTATAAADICYDTVAWALHSLKCEISPRTKALMN